jgi:dienelactone hydrolase
LARYFPQRPWTGAALFLVLALGAWLTLSFMMFVVTDNFSRPVPSGRYGAAVREVELKDPERGVVPARIWHPAVKDPVPSPTPLVLYAASWGGLRNENDVMLSNLASHGFLVVATDDVFYDPPSPTTDPRDEAARKAPFRLGTSEEFAAFPETGLRRSRLGRRKLSLVLDALSADAGQLGSFAIDMTRVSVIGFSHGGVVAGGMLAKDARVSAAVNLDGWVIGAEGMDIPPDKAMLSLYGEPVVRSGHLWPAPSSNWIIRMIRKDFEAQLTLSKRSLARSMLIIGAGHADFNDTLHERRRWLQWRPWRREVIKASEMRRTVDHLLLAFLQSPKDTTSERSWAATAGQLAKVRPLADADVAAD